MRYGLFVLAVLLAGCTAGAAAQQRAELRDLPVAGTLLYNYLWLSRPADVDHGGHGARFAGRFGVRAAPRTYVGVGVGSWAQAQTGGCPLPNACGEFADYWSEAVVYQLYLQHRPHPAFPAWGRAALGIANTYTLLPGGGLISVADRWRTAFSAGIGADMGLAPHIYITPSFDYTLLAGVGESSRELRHAMALGVGLTIR